MWSIVFTNCYLLAFSSFSLWLCRLPSGMATPCDMELLDLSKHPCEIVGFRLCNILNYTELLNSSHGVTNNYNFNMAKGDNLFKDKFVTKIKFKWLMDRNEGGIVFSASVKAEMRKHTTYSVKCVISKENKVHFLWFYLYLCHYFTVMTCYYFCRSFYCCANGWFLFENDKFTCFF